MRKLLSCISIHLTLPRSEHVTCMQMIPFLVYPRGKEEEEEEKKELLEFIDAIVWY